MNYTVVIPFYNEEKNVPLVNGQVVENLKKINDGSRSFEIIYVDDGSSDKTFDELKKLNLNPFETIIVKHRNNFGQASALITGINQSKYENLIMLDGDLQNDIDELQKMIFEYEKGTDMLVGWRRNRKDVFFSKTLPSIIANYFVRLFSQSKIHDHGCPFKILKKSTIDDLINWGDFHRLLAARLANNGFKVIEIEVKHNRRIHGKSNYGFGRVFKVLIDLIYLNFFKNYKRQSVYFFGQFGFFSFLIAFLLFVLMIFLRFTYEWYFFTTPLPLLIVFFLISGLIFLCMGILAQLIIMQQEEKIDKDNIFKEKIFLKKK